MAGLSRSIRFWRVVFGFAILVVESATPSVAAEIAAAPPAAPARFWFYREFFPDDTGDMPAVAMNGTAVGYALAGTSFYRDVPAGRYHLSVASYGLDLDQSQDLAVAPGQQVFVKIASLPSWEESSRGRSRRGTYYVMIVTRQMAALELPLTRYANGN